MTKDTGNISLLVASLDIGPQRHAHRMWGVGAAQMSQLKEHLAKTLKSPAQVMENDPKQNAAQPKHSLDAQLSGEGGGSKGGDLDQVRAQINGARPPEETFDTSCT